MSEKGDDVSNSTEPGLLVRDGVLIGLLRRPQNDAHGARGSIHDDATAAKLGFRGGTVAGQVHLELFPPLLLATFGPSWFERGTISVRFRNATIDREPVRACLRQPREQSKETQVEVWIERDDAIIVGEGSASVGETRSPTALRSVDLNRFEPGDLDILADISAGAELNTSIVDPLGDHQRERLHSMSDPIEWYETSSPWGGAVASPEAMAGLYLGPILEFVGPLRNAAPLVGALEFQNVSGPVFVDESYRVGGRVTAVGQSPKAEHAWFDMYADSPAGTRVSTSLIQIRWLKASSSQQQILAQ